MRRPGVPHPRAAKGPKLPRARLPKQPHIKIASTGFSLKPWSERGKVPH